MMGNMSMKNDDLKAFYDSVYRKGEDDHYTKLLLSKGKHAVDKMAVLAELDWKRKRVLDVGCGTGEFAFLAAQHGASTVVGLDYAPEAVAIAQEKYKVPGLRYECGAVEHISGTYDVIVSMGTIEHMDAPLVVLRHLKTLLAPGGVMIITCPNWSNPRGYILMTLYLLLDAKITLADIHFFTPRDFEFFAQELQMQLTWSTFDHEWAHGGKLLDDLARRLPGVAKDSHLNIDGAHIERLLHWLRDRALPLEVDHTHSGAIALYRFAHPL
jgi:2-polyprenyl-3-methyl-5-hydroxy-6-metoxy-1,4-benzoquinol methylase